MRKRTKRLSSPPPRTPSQSTEQVKSEDDRDFRSLNALCSLVHGGPLTVALYCKLECYGS